MLINPRIEPRIIFLDLLQFKFKENVLDLGPTCEVFAGFSFSWFP